MVKKGKDLAESSLDFQVLQEDVSLDYRFFDNMLNGFALHKIVVDDKNRPIDYIFLKVNHAFEELTGLKSKRILGKRVTEILPGIENAKFDWIGEYGRVAQTGKGIRFDQYSEQLDRWYTVSAYSPKKGFFVTLFHDITDHKKLEETLQIKESRLEALLKLNNITDAPLQEITDFALEEAVRLTGSKIGYLAFVNEDETVLTMHSWSKNAMKQCAIQKKPITYPVETTGLWGEALRQRKPIITNDYSADISWKKGYPTGHIEITRHMNVPLFDGKRIVAVAGVGNKEEEYEESDVRQLTLLMQGMLQLLQRKKAKEQLRRSEMRFRQFFEHEPSYCYMNSPEGLILDVNSAAVEALGYEKEDLVGKPLKMIYAPESLSKMKRLFYQWKKTGKLDDEEIIVQTKNGEARTVLLSANNIRDADGKILHSISVQKDITERKQSEEHIEYLYNVLKAIRKVNQLIVKERNKEKLLRTACKILTKTRSYYNAWILLMSEDGTVLNSFANKRNKQFKMILKHLEAGRFSNRLQQVFKQPGITVYSYKEIFSDDQVVEKDSDISVLATRLAQPHRIFGVLLVTAPREMIGAEEKSLFQEVADDLAFALTLIELEQANKEARQQSEFLLDLMAHDITNINQGLMSALEILAYHPDLTPSLLKSIELAQSQVDRSAQLITNVKRFSAIDQAPKVLRPRDVYLPLTGAAQAVDQAFPQKQLVLKSEVSEGQYFVLADGLLIEVFFNLLHNAMKFDPQNEVEVEVLVGPARRKNYIKIQIRDKGPGVPVSEKQKIVARFSSDEPLVYGTGIGLTLVRRLMERYGGRIHVQDRIKGDYSKGANFIIELPEAANHGEDFSGR